MDDQQNLQDPQDGKHPEQPGAPEPQKEHADMPDQAEPKDAPVPEEHTTRSGAKVPSAMEHAAFHRPIHPRRNLKPWLIAGGAAVVVILLLLYFFSRPDHAGEIVIPFISHQKPAVDPHLPSTNSLADKLDEVQFDGLFNLVAGPSGVMYEDGLGEFVGIDANSVVTIRLKAAKRWHDSWTVAVKDDKFTISKAHDHFFNPADLNFTLKRIQQLGSLSPDYILVSQALSVWGFEGPDQDNCIRFHFRPERWWKESDIKEVLSFKMLPDGSEMNAANYRNGTAAYLALPPKEDVSNYYRMPDGAAIIPNVLLAPFIDNSTYTTELRNNAINVMLDSPFGALSPILADSTKFFAKSNISNTFFALFFNTARLTRVQRVELRRLIDNRKILDRFYKVGTEQARHIIDYKGNRDNYYDYLNRSVFPTSSYYVEDSVVTPSSETPPYAPSVLPDTIRIQACVNAGFREESSELINILNDPSVASGRIRVTAVNNEELRKGNYDAVLVAVTGYRSNFLFDLYSIFLRDPDLETYRINLQTVPDGHGGVSFDPAGLRQDQTFFRFDLSSANQDAADLTTFLQYVYGFMSTNQVGDKQGYARRIDELEHRLCLGAWLFSMPSLAYFSTQFDQQSIDLYGVASQLSTVKKWQEKRK